VNYYIQCFVSSCLIYLTCLLIRPYRIVDSRTFRLSPLLIVLTLAKRFFGDDRRFSLPSFVKLIMDDCILIHNDDYDRRYYQYYLEAQVGNQINLYNYPGINVKLMWQPNNEWSEVYGHLPPVTYLI